MTFLRHPCSAQQFVLLLVLFVRPLPMSPKSDTLPDGDAYRRVIIRNLVCTVAICATYLTTTVVVVTCLLKQSPENKSVRSAGMLIAVAVPHAQA